MAKSRSQFVCQQCAATYPKWAGKCENCGEWNSLLEQVAAEAGANAVARSAGKGVALKGV